jgi:PAS domain S-box-containing protein
VVEGQRVRYADASFCDMSGYAREELEAMPSLAHVLREDEPGMDEEDRWCAASGEGEPRYEATLHRKDGRRVGVEVAIRAIAGDGPSLSVLVVREVSSHQTAQEQVRFQARLLAAVEQAVVATDMRGEVTYWNPAAERLYGWSAEEALGGSLSRFLASDDLRDRTDEIMAEVKGGRTWSGEFVVRCKDGTSLPVMVTGTPAYDEGGGDPVGVIGISTDLSERKRAGETLLAPETELKSLFWAMTDVILVFDRDGRYLKIAPTNPPLAYRPSADLIGRTLHEVLPKERADEFLEAIRRALETRQMVTLEYSREIAGREVWFAGMVSPLHDDSVVWVARDNTEPKRIEHALRLNEAKYRSLVEQLPALIYVESVDEGESEWDFLYISPQHEKLLGYSAEEWTTDNRFWERLIHPEDRERVVAEDARTDKTGEPFKIEYRFIARDGRTVWVHDEAELVYDEDGSALFWQGVMYDITEQKRVEEELRIRDRAIAATSNGIVISDPNRPDTPIAYVNPAFSRITGYSAAEAVGRNCRFLQRDDKEQLAVAELRSAIEQERGTRVVLRNYRKDGTLFWNELHLAPVKDDEGRLTHFIGVQTDVTERRRAEEEIQHLNESLERRVAERTAQLEAYAARLSASNRELQEFAYVASHDLQEPLRKVLTFGERLRTKFAGDLGERGLDYLGRMEEAAGRMQNLIEELLVLSRVTTRAKVFEPVDLIAEPDQQRAQVPRAGGAPHRRGPWRTLG